VFTYLNTYLYISFYIYIYDDLDIFFDLYLWVYRYIVFINIYVYDVDYIIYCYYIFCFRVTPLVYGNLLNKGNTIKHIKLIVNIVFLAVNNLINGDINAPIVPIPLISPKEREVTSDGNNYAAYTKNTPHPEFNVNLNNPINKIS